MRWFILIKAWIESACVCMCLVSMLCTDWNKSVWIRRACWTSTIYSILLCKPGGWQCAISLNWIDEIAAKGRKNKKPHTRTYLGQLITNSIYSTLSLCFIKKIAVISLMQISKASTDNNNNNSKKTVKLFGWKSLIAMEFMRINRVKEREMELCVFVRAAEK